jgi:LuxR family maltose regulon positive regulatory protein
MTLISGPAGSGKTSLLSSWIESRSRATSIAWVTVESRDRDVPQFWAHVLASLASTPGGRTGPIAKLTPPRTAGDEGFLSRFIDAVGSAGRPLVLLIDDEQETGSRKIDRLIERLAWLAPDSFRLVLATRRSPGRSRGCVLAARWPRSGETTSPSQSTRRDSCCPASTFS